MNKKIGLFFGSFNPVHVGHMIIANHIVEHTELDEVWMVVSPQNPFKHRKNLAPSRERLHLINLAIGLDNFNVRSSDIEFNLPMPSYTIDTLTYLKEKYDHQFTLMMGGDNIINFHKWKNYEQIIEHHDIIVYQRPGYEGSQFRDHPKVQVLNAPLLDISASFIRKEIKSNKSIQYLVPDKVFKYLKESNVYGFLK